MKYKISSEYNLKYNFFFGYKENMIRDQQTTIMIENIRKTRKPSKKFRISIIVKIHTNIIIFIRSKTEKILTSLLYCDVPLQFAYYAEKKNEKEHKLITNRKINKRKKSCPNLLRFQFLPLLVPVVSFCFQ